MYVLHMCTYVRTWYTCTGTIGTVVTKHYSTWNMCTYKYNILSRTNLKYKHTGATGKLVGVVSIEDIYGSNSTAMSAARISTTILASVWACTRTSACIASLRTVSVVVLVCGFHRWSSWLGTCSPGSGAVRASSQSRAALLTRPPVSRINRMTLSWSAYLAALTAA
jgi:hypothetical protein